jgi:glyoxylase-like metal-dependent hydrolase (beta-lactamase superfamily II)/ketosteroid isomerase-like protein
MRRALTLVMAAGLILPLVAAPTRPGPRKIEVAPGVFVFMTAPYGAIGLDGNSIVVLSRDGVMVFDSNGTPAAAAQVLGEIRAMTEQPVRYLVHSHWHWDHWYGAEVYKNAFPDVQIVAHEKTRALMAGPAVAFNKPGLERELPDYIRSIEERIAAGEGATPPAADLPALREARDDARFFLEQKNSVQHTLPTRTFSDRLDITLGGRRIQLLHFGRAVTPGDAVMYLPEERVRATGDLIVNPITFALSSYPTEWVQAAGGPPDRRHRADSASLRDRTDMKSIASFAVLVAIMQGAATPQSIVDDLLATDRRFAAEAANATAIPAITATFADDVVVPTSVPAPGFARGKTQAAEAMKANPDNVEGKVQWAPIRGGVSADGQHGFTFGYMTLSAGGKATPIKYVAYWVKQPAGWRVAVYKRVPADQSPGTRDMLAPATPARLVAPVSDPATIARYKASLEAAEKAFSDEAQTIGLGPAFAKHGSADAVNVGPRTSLTFVISAAEIGKSVGAGSDGKPSPVSWAADEGSIVASSGDLGVTFGYIRQNTPPPPGRPAAVPFITIWRRANPDQPWRYVAE